MKHYREQDLGDVITSGLSVLIQAELDDMPTEKRISKLTHLVAVLVAQQAGDRRHVMANEVAGYLYGDEEG